MLKLLGSQPSFKFLFGNHDVNKCFLLQIADLQADSVFFYFNFSVTLNVNQSTFNQNYYSFLTQLADMVGSSNTNVVTINSISFGSVIINGALSPTGGSGT